MKSNSNKYNFSENQLAYNGTVNYFLKIEIILLIESVLKD